MPQDEQELNTMFSELVVSTAREARINSESRRVVSVQSQIIFISLLISLVNGVLTFERSRYLTMQPRILQPRENIAKVALELHGDVLRVRIFNAL